MPTPLRYGRHAGLFPSASRPPGFLEVSLDSLGQTREVGPVLDRHRLALSAAAIFWIAHEFRRTEAAALEGIADGIRW